jgi:hypothetical protein
MTSVGGETSTSPLKRLAVTDRRIVKGFHSVAKEAADAIENIQEDKVGHRRKRGVYFAFVGRGNIAIELIDRIVSAMA